MLSILSDQKDLKFIEKAIEFFIEFFIFRMSCLGCYVPMNFLDVPNDSSTLILLPSTKANFAKS